jgi:integrase
MTYLPHQQHRHGQAIDLAAARAHRDLIKRFGHLNEDWRMSVSAEQLMNEVFFANTDHIKDRQTLIEYRSCQEHWIEWLSHLGITVFNAGPNHVRLYIGHLLDEYRGDPAKRSPYVESCPWCAKRNYPTGRKGGAYSASFAKKNFAALRALYRHCLEDSTLPPVDPTRTVMSPKVVNTRQYFPTEEEVRRLLHHPCSPRTRFAMHWLYYAPARRNDFVDALWRDIESELWSMTTKGQKVHSMLLHPRLLQVMRQYRAWQAEEAKRYPAMMAALADPDTAYVLMTKRGTALTGGQLARIVKRHAVRAGVGVIPAKSATWETRDGKTSRVTPHAMRRAWATHAHNSDGVSVEAVRKALGHADISTTMRHYCFTDDEQGFDALGGRGL